MSWSASGVDSHDSASPESLERSPDRSLLLVAPESVFNAIVPILIVAACVLLAFQLRIAAAVAARENRRPGTSINLQLHGSVFLAATYGAYFGGGNGVIRLAVLGIFVADHIQQTNAMKTALSLVVNTVALLIFALFAPLAWSAVAIVAPASLIGGYVGGGVARQLSAGRLRAAVFGLVVAVWLIVD
ncbi:MAG: putative membrane protein YfcA [Ilumatobacter sp.]|jgi:uncharacterized membrane protein YfcA